MDWGLDQAAAGARREPQCGSRALGLASWGYLRICVYKLPRVHDWLPAQLCWRPGWRTDRRAARAGGRRDGGDADLGGGQLRAGLQPRLRAAGPGRLPGGRGAAAAGAAGGCALRV